MFYSFILFFFCVVTRSQTRLMRLHSTCECFVRIERHLPAITMSWLARTEHAEPQPQIVRAAQSSGPVAALQSTQASGVLLPSIEAGRRRRRFASVASANNLYEVDGCITEVGFDRFDPLNGPNQVIQHIQPMVQNSTVSAGSTLLSPITVGGNGGAHRSSTPISSDETSETNNSNVLCDNVSQTGNAENASTSSTSSVQIDETSGLSAPNENDQNIADPTNSTDSNDSNFDSSCSSSATDAYGTLYGLFGVDYNHHKEFHELPGKEACGLYNKLFLIINNICIFIFRRCHRCDGRHRHHGYRKCCARCAEYRKCCVGYTKRTKYGYIRYVRYIGNKRS